MESRLVKERGDYMKKEMKNIIEEINKMSFEEMDEYITNLSEEERKKLHEHMEKHATIKHNINYKPQYHYRKWKERSENHKSI